MVLGSYPWSWPIPCRLVSLLWPSSALPRYPRTIISIFLLHLSTTVCSLFSYEYCWRYLTVIDLIYLTLSTVYSVSSFFLTLYTAPYEVDAIAFTSLRRSQFLIPGPLLFCSYFLLLLVHCSHKDSSVIFNDTHSSPLLSTKWNNSLEWKIRNKVLCNSPCRVE